jgi:Protein of unknown function (DUF2591)
MKTSELTGALLDYWVARAEGYADAGSGRRLPDHSVCVRQVSEEGPLCCLIFDRKKPTKYLPEDDFFQPSVDWTRGGPIIERERICIGADPEGRIIANRRELYADRDQDGTAVLIFPEGGAQVGPTVLVAAMRVYVASKFGEEVPDQPGRAVLAGGLDRA